MFMKDYAMVTELQVHYEPVFRERPNNPQPTAAAPYSILNLEGKRFNKKKYLGTSLLADTFLLELFNTLLITQAFFTHFFQYYFFNTIFKHFFNTNLTSANT